MILRRFIPFAAIILCLFVCLFVVIPEAEEGDGGSIFGPKVIMIDEVEPEDVLGDMFEPVLFRHKYHAKIVKDCSVCHHFFEEHYNDQIVPSSRCEGCHFSKTFKSMGRNFACRVCHETDASPEVRNIRSKTGALLMIPGLKAAYHRHCIECHEEMGGPVGCGECHLTRVPDHTTLINDYEGAITCEKCHAGKIDEVQRTIHYRLSKSYSMKRPTESYGQNLPREIGMINGMGRLFGTDAIAAWDIKSDKACKSCHIGMGVIPFSGEEQTPQTDSEFNNVDCLICHVDKGYSYKVKQQAGGDFGKLIDFARSVSHTKSTNCQRCHTGLTSISGFNAVSPEYSNLRGTPFEPQSDIHASIGVTCFDCHYARDHMFKRQVSPFVQAGDFQLAEQGCARCHRDVHIHDEYLKMTTIMSCTGCHVPDRGGPIEVNLEDRSKPTTIKSRVVFKWFNRTLDVNGMPQGNRNDGILYPYRVAVIREPLDENGEPIPIDIETGAVPKSIKIGMWREREVYIPLSHGVRPKGAYTCADCHGKTTRFDWESMGIKIKALK